MHPWRRCHRTLPTTPHHPPQAPDPCIARETPKDLKLLSPRRGGVPGTSAGRVRRGLHICIAVGFKLELEAAEADGRLNDAGRDNLAMARSRVDILESGNGPNRYDEVLVGLSPGGIVEYLLAGAPNTPAPLHPPFRRRLILLLSLSTRKSPLQNIPYPKPYAPTEALKI